MVQVHHLRNPRKTCAAVLLSPSVVVTVADCVQNFSEFRSLFVRTYESNPQQFLLLSEVHHSKHVYFESAKIHQVKS